MSLLAHCLQATSLSSNFLTQLIIEIHVTVLILIRFYVTANGLSAASIQSQILDISIREREGENDGLLSIFSSSSFLPLLPFS
jgi:hypothetical protein